MPGVGQFARADEHFDRSPTTQPSDRISIGRSDGTGHIPVTGLYRLCRKNVLSGVSFRVALYPTTKPVWMR
jgi:hypothetical protein